MASIVNKLERLAYHCENIGCQLAIQNISQRNIFGKCFVHGMPGNVFGLVIWKAGLSGDLTLPNIYRSEAAFFYIMGFPAIKIPHLHDTIKSIDIINVSNLKPENKVQLLSIALFKIVQILDKTLSGFYEFQTQQMSLKGDK